MNKKLSEDPNKMIDKLDIHDFQAICKDGKRRIDVLAIGFNRQLCAALSANGTAFYSIDNMKEVFSPWFDNKLQSEKARENLKFDIPIINEVLNSKELKVLDHENCDEKNLVLLNALNAEHVAITPASIGNDIFAINIIWKEAGEGHFNETQLEILEAGVNVFEILVNEVTNSAHLNSQVNEFALIQEALMNLTNTATLEDALKSFIDSLENLFDDFFGAQIYLYSFGQLEFSAGKWDDKWHNKQFSVPEPGGVNSTVAKSGRTLLISDVQKSELFQERDYDWGGSLIVAPLNARDRTVGVVNVRLNSIGEIQRDKVRLVELLADQAAKAIEHELDNEQIHNRSKELEVLLDTSFALTSTLELDEIKNIVVDNAMKLSPEALNAFLFLYDGEFLDFGAAKWAGIQKDVNDFIPRKDGLTYSVAKSGQRIIIEDVTKHEFYADGSYVKGGWKGAIVSMPIKHGERVVGVLTLAFSSPQNFNVGTINVLQILTDQAALAIQNSRLHVRTTAQANTDFLTGLGNRRAFSYRLEEEINRAKRYGQKFCLLLCDLDDMKLINDKFGHLTGDKVLQIVAGIFIDNVRESDYVYRWGGDEFVILIPEASDKDAMLVGEKLLDTIKNYPYPWRDEDDMILSMSIGVACYPEFDTKQKLIQKADEILYKGKKNQK